MAPSNIVSSPSASSSSSSPRPTPHPKPNPVLRIHLNDLSQKGTVLFLSSLPVSHVLEDAVATVLRHLYSPHSTSVPPTRSITLIIRPMDGVAYTTGLQIDDAHKEIHFNTRYIEQVSLSRLAEELTGVIVHEMVHCYQHNGLGTAPGGLIEGIADWVRLQAGLAPPHWKKEAGGRWDAGYQHTGYFLDYLEQRFGRGTVMRVNERLKGRRYEEKEFWQDVVGKSVKDLWADYQQKLEDDLDEQIDASVHWSSAQEQKKATKSFNA
ncbi:BSP-domain-containing protein [Pseudovirgaria hyperparasitica]|uniref:BSP-domain-containing protein n=1 Tax=Pseudovirgaria hyperparasitica TaxID=470096 RepID=A0A6A6WFG0_9PEZI|nr:BSP-domain-containing protein [Pseudovirgaria hyperparasitica]KAF2760626.1 BSP-domain-containing protein [Pseudovirgaria hyperparasitica]